MSDVVVSDYRVLINFCYYCMLVFCVFCFLERDETEGRPLLVPFWARGSMFVLSHFGTVVVLPRFQKPEYDRCTSSLRRNLMLYNLHVS
jgi:hypothetical protein